MAPNPNQENDPIAQNPNQVNDQMAQNPNRENDHSILEKNGETFKTPAAARPAPREYKIVYRNVLVYSYLHISAIYAIYLLVTERLIATYIFGYIYTTLGGFGVTAGAHRLWTHRAYKAKLPLQIILMLLQTSVYQLSVIDWVREHRLHHRHTDTDADPHNSSRGLFFSHVGWLLVRKHPEVKRQGKHTDLSDVLSNPVLVFQKKYIVPLVVLFRLIIPISIPMYFWGESLYNMWHFNIFAYVLSLNYTWTVNSLAHAWGYKPYDSKISPTQNLFVSYVTSGEGFHNYHHVYPWDYRTSEMGNNLLNHTTLFIDFFAWIGWAYDLKTVPDDVIKARAEKTGDGKDMWGRDTDMKKKVDS